MAAPILHKPLEGNCHGSILSMFACIFLFPSLFSRSCLPYPGRPPFLPARAMRWARRLPLGVARRPRSTIQRPRALTSSPNPQPENRSLRPENSFWNASACGFIHKRRGYCHEPCDRLGGVYTAAGTVEDLEVLGSITTCWSVLTHHDTQDLREVQSGDRMPVRRG